MIAKSFSQSKGKVVFVMIFNDMGRMWLTMKDLLVPKSRKINNKELSADISLTASDVGALESGGTAAAAAKLASSRTIQTNLSSTSSASFNGTANVTPGVTGVLSVQNGGTGVDNLDDLKALLGAADVASIFGVSKVLNENSWEDISKISNLGLGADCWSVGDTKSVLINGTIGTLAVNNTYWAFILGFNHNSAIEGKGITFGGFKTAQTGGKDICLVDSKYYANSYDGTKYFNLNHWGSTSSPRSTNYGGWKGCDARYDILGSTNKEPSGYGSTATTDRVGYDPENYDIVTNPVANTLMAALPQDLRAAMKPITKYTDNTGNRSNVLANVTASVDYLPLLAEFEVFGTGGNQANVYERNYQKQYAYYAAGNSRIRYRHSAAASASAWFERSPIYFGNYEFCHILPDGTGVDNMSSSSSEGIAPVFMV